MAEDQARRARSPEAPYMPTDNILDLPAASVDNSTLDLSASRADSSPSPQARVNLSSPAPAPDWTRYWPIPIFGAAYLLHTSLRRYSPRRLPTLTSLKPAEIYVSTTAYMLWLSEYVHIAQEANRDRDMYTILAATHILRLELEPKMEKWRGMDEWKNTEAHDVVGISPPQGGLLAKLAWRYNFIAESDPVAVNVAIQVITRLVIEHLGDEGPKRFSPEDGKTLMILLANSIVAAEKEAAENFKVTEKRCIIGLGLVTPLAMWARWSRRRYLVHPLNMAQRLLVYGGIFPDIITIHRRVHYASTIRDKHRVAELCREIIPKLSETVDGLMQSGVEIISI